MPCRPGIWLRAVATQYDGPVGACQPANGLEFRFTFNASEDISR